jgi:hypothetical protein
MRPCARVEETVGREGEGNGQTVESRIEQPYRLTSNT